MEGSAWRVVMSFLAESSLCSSYGGATGDELLARFLLLRSRGVFTACESLHINCSSGEATGCGACLEESLIFPRDQPAVALWWLELRAADSLRWLGVLLSFFLFPICCASLSAFDVSIDLGAFPARRAGSLFPASHSLAVSTVGAPSMD